MTIEEDSLRDALGNRLLVLESQIYQVRRRTLDGIIGAKLIEIAAREVAQSTDEYLKRECSRRAAPVADEEVRAVYDSGKSRLENGSESDVLASIRISMQRSRLAQARELLVGELRQRYPVRVWLVPPRVQVPALDGPGKGPAAAPVRVVVFSDFQCPYCAQLAATLRELHSRFGEQVRLEYRHYPLPMHKDGALAAEAAACMADQGRFWEMHDTLYANQKRLAREDLRGYVDAAGGDSRAFEECLDSRRNTPRVTEDKKLGQSLGVTATPSTFVNGRLVSGAAPLQDFIDIVQDELDGKRGGLRSGSPARR